MSRATALPVRAGRVERVAPVGKAHRATCTGRADRTDRTDWADRVDRANRADQRVTASRKPARRGAVRARTPRDRGQASLEFLGMLPFLLLVALAGIQLGIAAYCGSQAGTAARTAARTAAQAGPDGGTDAGARAGRDAVSGWVHPGISYPDVGPESVTARATVHIPSVLPGLHLFDPVKRSATMPKEDWTP